tara:strand:+ start:1014 stop:1271 length:258 start_codon:yes stop_codon:yes gene_type:complete
METQTVIEGWRGVAVSMGLGTPIARAATAGAIAGTACYILKYPREAFRRDGSMRPHHRLSPSQDATDKHFLLTPLMIAGAVYLFT